MLPYCLESLLSCLLFVWPYGETFLVFFWEPSTGLVRRLGADRLCYVRWLAVLLAWCSAIIYILYNTHHTIRNKPSLFKCHIIRLMLSTYTGNLLTIALRRCAIPRRYSYHLIYYQQLLYLLLVVSHWYCYVSLI